jgi:RNA polymerase sigma-54 factor
MALELRQSLSLAQQLIMTPQLQQAIKLLQLSRLELLDAIYEEMETNPALEEAAAEEGDDKSSAEDAKDDSPEGEADVPEVTVEERARDDVDWESYLSEYNTGWAEPAPEQREAPPLENIFSAKTNLYSHLLWQLNLSSLNEEQKHIGEYLIGNLDEDGYLHTPLEEIAQGTGFPGEMVLGILQVIQNFDPVGVAARDMRECLLLQCRFQELAGTAVEKIILDHLPEVELRQYDKIAKQLSIEVEEVVSAVSIIQRFEPKPGRSYSDEEPIYITPDIYVFKMGDDYEIVLNEDGLPKLRISPYYKEVLSNQDSLPESTRTYIQEKLRSASWLIKSIHQRQRTIYRVTESIVRFQRDFFDRGIAYLKPLVLRHVAEDIQMHESTVSRVTNNKYVYTPQGVVELKFFFNSALSSTGGGEDIASESVKAHIRNIIKTENKGKPKSDQEIADILKKENIRVARRTVAKYRESMGILPSRRRRNPF